MRQTASSQRAKVDQAAILEERNTSRKGHASTYTLGQRQQLVNIMVATTEAEELA
jgi:hypothetical protein